ncbi:EamA-like transporter family protein [Brevundimonas sp. SH203]|uniref:DMT family transporter n=1 Tax=Brevundimonas sp. SH203 TaxID=345167 RepID=UPI0009C4765B|nr:DMT family transporter [Brevundimonas sp. SH203]GAW41072.1 EamA-like transporter family protein [Brevundimonas sp. SH203]
MTDQSVTSAASRAPASSRRWLLFAFLTVGLWGVWGAYAGISAQRGFPETLVYCVWAVTMIVPAVVVMQREKWALDRDPRSILYGLMIGLTGAGGQMILFYAVTTGPAYLIFPIISLSPLVTILLSLVLLKERTSRLGALGVVLALAALPMFDFSPQGFSFAHGSTWFPLALVIMLCWGVQAFFMKLANDRMSAESIFFYMMVSGLLLAPVALAMTDFSRPINWGWDGPGLAAAIQMLNAVGALFLVYAFRHGKAIVVAPLTNAGAPLVTAVLSLLIAGVVPGQLKMVGLALAFIAAALLATAS